MYKYHETATLFGYNGRGAYRWMNGRIHKFTDNYIVYYESPEVSFSSGIQHEFVHPTQVYRDEII